MSSASSLTALSLSFALLAGSACAAHADLSASALADSASPSAVSDHASSALPVAADKGGAGILGKPPAPTATPSGGGGGFTSRIAFAKLITTGSGKTATSSLQVVVAWPDGSGQVQVTSTGSNKPMSWSQSGWMAIEDNSSASIRILNVPTGNPASASQVASFPRPTGATGGFWSAQRDALGAVLPASQQRLAFREGIAAANQIVARRHDGSDPVVVASATTTCIPAQTPGCSGSRFDHYLFGWLPSDAATGTIGVMYARREIAYSGGVQTSDTVTYRVATLSSTAWPAATVVADAPVLFGGAPVTALNLTISRDGTLVAYDEDFDAANEPYQHVAPLEYNPVAGTTTLRSDQASNRADTTGTPTVIHYPAGFSPDNSQLVLRGIKDPVTDFQPSVFVSGATTSSPVVEVDGTTRQTEAPIWGP